MSSAQIIDHGFHQGRALKEVRLTSAGLSLGVMNIGVATRDLRWIAGGEDRPMVLGYGDPAEYLSNPGYLGVIAGRVAGRIKDARFDLFGTPVELEANEGANQLHGGPVGLSHVPWEIDLGPPHSVRFSYVSQEGENGFPGKASFSVTVTLQDSAVIYDMRATVNRPTPISLAQHSYYNLTGGQAPIWDHTLWADVTGYLGLDRTHVPDGRILDLDGTPYDLRWERSFGELDPKAVGSDVNLVFAPQINRRLPAARLVAPDGMQMAITTDQPGAQLYTAPGLQTSAAGLAGQTLGPFMGVCFEPQGFPNSVNHPHFPNVITAPDRPYRQVLRLDFSRG